ncbi:MAG: hypothetical protein HOV80_04260 [Polyangiaceae bacterium]|nr:hypothetical protein [Polyangiaceae bacterium]
MVLALVLTAMSWMGSARADSAQEWFAKGKEASERGDYQAAARAFDEAYALEAFPIAKYNAAENWFEVPGGKEAARAADAYRVAIEADERVSEGRLKLDSTLRARALDRLARLSQSLCLVEATTPVGAKISVDRLVDVPIPTRFYLAPGTYSVSGTLEPGDVRTAKIVCKANASASVVWPRAEAKVVAPPPVVPPRDVPKQPEPQPFDAQLAGGIATMVLGGAFAGAAIGLGVHTLEVRDEFVATGNADADLRDEAVSFRSATTAMWILSGVAHATGLVVIISSPTVLGSGDEPKASAGMSWSLHASPGGFSFDGRF